MVILGIDTSSTDLSVCLCVDNSPVSTVNRYVRNSHAEHITQAVKVALDLGGIAAEEVTHVAVSVGPGSFTGLRIGLSFVKGFCMMTERKVFPLSSLMTLAHAAGSHLRHKKIFTALDARQGRVHWGGFVFNGDNGNKMQRLTGDRLSSPEELMKELSSDDILVTDAMGYSRSTVFEAFTEKAKVISAENSALTRGISCAAIALENINNESVWIPAQNVTPNYLQMSAAEEKKTCN
jgi:tRNA threonylcarbamoyladenosine biosynthesis protein TsaB